MTFPRPTIAFWCPMPPSHTAVAQYGYSMLLEIRRYFSLTLVLPSYEINNPILPRDIAIISAEEAMRGHLDQADINIYHVGNHDRFHSWMLEAINTKPGLVILHDVSLFDLTRSICADSPVLWSALTRRHGYDETLSNQIDVDGVLIPDRIKYTFTKDIVDASLCTVVHSKWSAEYLGAMHPKARIEYIPLAAKVIDENDFVYTRATLQNQARQVRLARNPRIITILGGINSHKRILTGIDAFAQVAKAQPSALLRIVGRSDNLELLNSIRALINKSKLDDRVELHLDVTEDQLDNFILESILIVALRWPTAGETSGAIMQALGAGRPVVTSDIPQFSGFDERFVFRIKPNTPTEVDEIAQVMLRAVEQPDDFRQAGALAKEFVRTTSTWPLVIEKYIHLLAEINEGRSSSKGEPHNETTASAQANFPGVNVYGDFTATTGLAHAARRLSLSLLRNGVPLSVTEVSTGAPKSSSLFPIELRSRKIGTPFPVDLWTLNINEFHLITEQILRSVTVRRYHIATWYWELPMVPDAMIAQLHRIDEVWAPTNFVARTLRRYTNIPIHIVPTVVRTMKPSGPIGDIRAKFNIPRSATVFLFTFDFNSTVGRKNPIGVINAFAKAFPSPSSSNPILVLKSLNLNFDPTFERILRQAMDSIGGILIDSYLSEHEISDLLCSCDVYVSLHRAEGFGLGMAEAMAIGKPVIGTGYSGNLDFMNTNNSCLVGYSLRRITSADLAQNKGMSEIYQEGSLWAEPNLAQAADWMRILAADTRLRIQIGTIAAKDISSGYSDEAIGRIAKKRLRNLYLELGLIPFTHADKFDLELSSPD